VESTTFSSAPQAAKNAKEVKSRNLIDDGILNLQYIYSDYTTTGNCIIGRSIPELKKGEIADKSRESPALIFARRYG
jgi:hypothetical protein